MSLSICLCVCLSLSLYLSLSLSLSHSLTPLYTSNSPGGAERYLVQKFVKFARASSYPHHHQYHLPPPPSSTDDCWSHYRIILRGHVRRMLTKRKWAFMVTFKSCLLILISLFFNISCICLFFFYWQYIPSLLTKPRDYRHARETAFERPWSVWINIWAEAFGWMVKGYLYLPALQWFVGGVCVFVCVSMFFVWVFVDV